MAYPPTVPPATRTNATPQVDNHPGDHNAISAAFTDIINELGANPSGAAATIQARLDALEAKAASYAVAHISSDVATNGTTGSAAPWIWAPNGSDLVGETASGRGHLIFNTSGVYYLLATCVFVGASNYVQTFAEVSRGGAPFSTRNALATATGGYATVTQGFGMAVLAADQLEVRINSASIGPALNSISELLVWRLA